MLQMNNIGYSITRNIVSLNGAYFIFIHFNSKYLFPKFYVEEVRKSYLVLSMVLNPLLLSAGGEGGQAVFFLD